MNTFLDIVVPRFVTEEVAFVELEDGYHIIAPLANIQEGESYHATGMIRCFNFFGFALFPKMVEGSFKKI